MDEPGIVRRFGSAERDRGKRGGIEDHLGRWFSGVTVI